MQITNNNHLPMPIYRAILNTTYKGQGHASYASVTGLLKGIKQFVLEQRYQEELEEDASDRIWALMGSAIHSVLEKSETDDNLAEIRLQTNIDDKILSGGVDLYENGVIYDFKFTSVWSYLSNARILDWVRQLNMYAYLYRKAGFEVHTLKIIAIYRDWQKSRYMNLKENERYPRQVEEIELPLWDMDETEAYIRERFALIEEAMELPDDMIAPCTPDERWEAEPTYAVIKKGGQRASKVCDSLKAAEAYLNNLKDKDSFIIEHRKGSAKKCLEYCPVASYCHFAQQKQLAEAI